MFTYRDLRLLPMLLPLEVLPEERVGAEPLLIVLLEGVLCLVVVGRDCLAGACRVVAGVCLVVAGALRVAGGVLRCGGACLVSFGLERVAGACLRVCVSRVRLVALLFSLVLEFVASPFRRVAVVPRSPRWLTLPLLPSTRLPLTEVLSVPLVEVRTPLAFVLRVLCPTEVILPFASLLMVVLLLRVLLTLRVSRIFVRGVLRTTRE